MKYIHKAYRCIDVALDASLYILCVFFLAFLVVGGAHLFAVITGVAY